MANMQHCSDCNMSTLVDSSYVYSSARLQSLRIAVWLICTDRGEPSAIVDDSLIYTVRQ